MNDEDIYQIYDKVREFSSLMGLDTNSLFNQVLNPGILSEIVQEYTPAYPTEEFSIGLNSVSSLVTNRLSKNLGAWIKLTNDFDPDLPDIIYLKIVRIKGNILTVRSEIGVSGFISDKDNIIVTKLVSLFVDIVPKNISNLYDVTL